MGRARPHVVYWNHSPTPYFVERFNAIAAQGAIDFEAWFNERLEAIRSWEVHEDTWAFPARYIPSRSVLGRGIRLPAAELRRSRPDLLVQEYDRGHLVAGFLCGRLLASRTAFRVLPNFDAWSRRTWWRETGKRFVFRAVDCAKVPGPDGRRLAERYGLDGDRIAEVTQSIDVERLAAGRDLSAQQRADSRRELGLAGCVFVFAGRLWEGKGIDDLLDAYESVIASGREVSLLLLGDGPDEARCRERAAGLPRVVFGGFVQAPRIASFYGLADVMVFPTHGDPHGLVVEEAMAAGLPVICSSAAGDIALRLPEGEAGFVVPVKDSATLARRMRELADDQALRSRLGRCAQQLADSRSHERYASDFERFVELALSLPPRKTPAASLARLAGRALDVLSSGHDQAPLVSGSAQDEETVHPTETGYAASPVAAEHEVRQHDRVSEE